VSAGEKIDYNDLVTKKPDKFSKFTPREY